MQYSATAKYIRQGPRKIRLLADSMRRKNAVEAVAILGQLSKRTAKPMMDVISSALANAKIKNAKTETLTITEIDVQEGPVMKRWHAVSKGSAHGFKKQMTHIKVVLSDGKKDEAKSS
jgi:large subunit ribosomal protein L22